MCKGHLVNRGVQALMGLQGIKVNKDTLGVRVAQDPQDTQDIQDHRD